MARRADRADLAVAGGLAAIAVWVLHDAAGYPPSVVPGVPGPAAFPRLVALVLIVLAGVMAVRALRGEGSAPEAPSRSGLLRNLASLGLLVAFLLIAERTDFFLAMLLLVLGLMAVLGERGARAAGTSLLFVAFLYVVFYQVFGVHFPTRL